MQKKPDNAHPILHTHSQLRLKLKMVKIACSTTAANVVANDVQGNWCIAKPSAYNFQLLRNIDYSCGQNGVDCRPIQPGGSCFRPDTAFAHASYAMNLFFKAAGKHPWDCHFNGTGIAVTQDPCKYPVEILPLVPVPIPCDDKRT
ncbi:unnamed protein product [Dovyalis caffra]|uniref:X8 domain-containing protein n=1 Tax=Dovyalis caffra TaxID=77055 RepID=A0AAV1SEB6_9ROSI|nr:unnamed protein product [Dovyalis caffra]